MDQNVIYAKGVLHDTIQPQVTINYTVKTETPEFDRDVLHELYVEKGLSQRQIAAHLASSKTTIKEALDKAGIKQRSRGTGHPTNHPHILPYGVKFENGEICNDSFEQEIIAKIIEQHRHGMSIRKIAEWLTDQKIPTRNNAKAWHPEKVRKILIKTGDHQSMTRERKKS